MSNLGDHLLYGMLPNMFVNRCTDPHIIRVNAEINAWARNYFAASDTLLSNSISLAEKHIKERGGGSTQTDFRCVVRLPSSLHSPGSYCIYSTGGWDDLPNILRAPKLVEETELVSSIIEELRGTLAVDIDPKPTMDRWPIVPSQFEQPAKSYLVVGTSHAARLASSLVSLGNSVDTENFPQQCNCSGGEGDKEIRREELQPPHLRCTGQ
jgi:hypothetical protein